MPGRIGRSVQVVTHVERTTNLAPYLRHDCAYPFVYLWEISAMLTQRLIDPCTSLWAVLPRDASPSCTTPVPLRETPDNLASIMIQEKKLHTVSTTSTPHARIHVDHPCILEPHPSLSHRAQVLT